ncbi:hypothetical protein CFC21_026050 [Triticum aestivum]|uniref:Uncharacterized protein n=2 Tax=Triticum aestivum TaxID=4565 RepID=A0A3B6CF34_WHEAT|nr:uncharacterized protein LOC123042458 [Triticum aestivum]KAF7011779.1 hypothetical protein CFC21_026050 [Triticum aestivum]
MALAAAASSVGVASVALLLLLIANASASDASLEARRALPGREIHLEPIVYPENAQSTVGSSPWRRSAEETPPSPANNSLVLAAKRTRRNDPSANNTMYGGGWNISEMHYWASVGYTGVPFFFLALVWFVGFGVVMLVISCCWCCCCFCRDRSDDYSPASFNASLILLVILTIATIVGCLLLNIGQMAFHTSTTNTVDYVVGQGNLTVDNLRNFAGSLAAAKNIGVDQIFLPVEVQRKIDVVEEKLNSSANEFSARIVLNSDKIKNVVDLMQVALMDVGSIMLVLAILGLIFSVLGLQCFVSLLVIAGWVFVTVTLMMAGGFVLLHNVVGDTCVAMDEWVTHPQDHTALDDILPCVDVGTANESMHRSEEVTAQLVALVNNVIVNISNRDFPPGLQPLYFNQSGPKMPVLCNPLKPDMSPRECASGEVDFKTAPGEWKKFQCQAKGPAGKEVCTTVGRVTPAAYNQMTAAASISMGLYEYGPFLMNLQDCTFVRETFTSISVNNCPGLRYFSRTVYHGLILVSASVMVSIVCWMVHTRQRSLRGKQE